MTPIARIKPVSFAVAMLLLPPVQAQTKPAEEAAAAVPVQAQRNQSVVVTGRQEPAAGSAVKGGLTYKENPQSLQSLNVEQIAEQQSQSLSAILLNVSGFSQTRSDIEVFRSFKLRGFDVADTTTDGIRNTGSLNIQPDGLASIERVEVLKGPSAALFGSGAIGGGVNIVSKRPSAVPVRELQFGVGSDGYRQAGLDLGGPIDAAGSVRWRLVADARGSDNFVRQIDQRLWQIAPSLAIDLGRATTLTLQGDWRERRGERYVGLPLNGTVLGTDQLEIPRDTYLGDPAVGKTVNEGQQFTTAFDHRFSETTTGRLALRTTRNTFDQPVATPRSDAVLDLGTGRYRMQRGYNRFDEVEREWVADASLNTRVQWLGLQHKIGFGAEASRWTYDSQFFAGSMAPVDVLAPVYGQQPTGVFLLDDTRELIAGQALYVQDHVALSPDLSVTLGLRWDRFKSEALSRAYGTQGDRSDSAVSPRLGLVYTLSPAASVFVSASSAIKANAFESFANVEIRPFAPQKGRQLEAGVRLDLAKRLSGTLAAYRITQRNVLTADPNDPTGNYSIPVGEQSSQGIEADLLWQPLAGLRLQLAYAYTDARIERDNTFAAGNRLKNVARHAGRAWGVYEWAAAGGRVGLAGGATFTSDMPGDLGNTFVVPGWTVLDAMAFYETGNWRLQLNVNNLTDKAYFHRAAFSRNQGVIPGAPRSGIASVRWRF